MSPNTDTQTAPAAPTDLAALKALATRPAADNEILISREIQAPLDLVWQLWTDPNLITQWWGPSGFTTTHKSDMQVQVGGTWRFNMHGPDGKDWPNRIRYTKVQAKNLLEYDHDSDVDGDPQAFKAQAVFLDYADRTVVTLRLICKDKADCDAKKVYAVEGGKQTMGRLADLCAKLQTPSAAALEGSSPFKLVLERTFNAPPELVYQCWTDETLLKQWFVPAPWSLHSADMDVRAGGKFNSTMKDPDGNLFPNEGIFLEVTPNRKLVTTDAFRQGYLPSKNAPFMVAHVEFIPQNGGQQTRYIATAHHWNLDTQKQHEAMGFHDGWGAAADQLAALLAKLQAKA